MKPRFPPPESAGPDGLLLVGGQLTPDWLQAAYRQGIFPWPHRDMWDRWLLMWFSPDPRAVLELDALHVSRRLRRRIRRGEFQVTCDRACEEVIRQCSLRGSEGSWITLQMLHAYRQLHRQGLAHSVETWQGGRLVGGVYGVSTGACFSAESSFYRRRDASKVAIYYLVQRLRQRGYRLLDIQQWTEHTGRLGAVEIPRSEFLQRLRAARDSDVTFGPPGEVRE